MKRALLDANVLVAVIHNKSDVAMLLRERDFEPLVCKSVLNEIKSKGGALANAIENYLKLRKIAVVESDKVKADDDLIALSAKGFAVVTLDAGLKRRLKKAGAQVITLKREGRRVQII